MNHKKRMSFSFLVEAVLCIILIPIIIVNVLLIVSSYTQPNKMPSVFGIKPTIVLSGSMEPNIKIGDLIFINETDPSQLKEGDVICYIASEKAITHRIVEITTAENGEIRFVTQGDANNVVDQRAVSIDQIEGIWNGGRIQELGNIILYMQSTTGMILCIVCPLLLLFIWDVWRRWKADKAEAAKTAQLEAELAVLRAKEQSNKNNED